MNAKCIILATIILISTLVIPMNSVYATKNTESANLRIKHNDNIYEYDRVPDLYINGEKLVMDEMPPIITKSGKTFVSVREIFEALGAEVKWDGSKKQVYILLDDKFIIFTVNENLAKVNGENVLLDDTVKMVYNLSKDPEVAKVIVPLRFILHTLDFDMFWDKDKYSIYTFGDYSIKKDVKPEEDKKPLIEDDITTDPENEQENKNNANIGKPVKTELADNPVIWSAANDGVEEESDNNYIDKDIKKYETTSIKNVEYIETDNGLKQFIITASSKISSIEHILWENKLIVDVINSRKKFTEEKIRLKDNLFATTIRSSQYNDDPYVTRVIFDLTNGALNYDINYSSDRKKIIINLKKNQVYEVTMKQDDQGDYLTIKGKFQPRTNLFRLTNPERLVIDVPFSDSALLYKEADVKGQYVDKVRTSQFDTTTTRVVLEMSGQPSYDVSYNGNETKIRIIRTTYNNIRYANNERPQIILKKITNHNIDINNIKIENNYLDRTARITLPEGSYNKIYGYGKIAIKDDNLSEIKFRDNNSKYEIDIESNHIFEYRVTEDSNNYYINVMKPKEVYDKIVVVDPGHGDTDPGKPQESSNYTGLDEKTINIDIGMRLLKLLENDTSVKVYMTRVDDTLPEKFYTADMTKPILMYRSEFANDIEADLLVSIHNNAFKLQKINGTEVFYYNDGGYNKKIAAIIHDNLMNKIDIRDRGLKEGNGLYLLRKTKMPAVLVEIGYMTNKIDAAKLLDDNFKQQTAQGLYNGIVEALNAIVGY